MKAWIGLMLALTVAVIVADTTLTARDLPMPLDAHGSGPWIDIDEPDQPLEAEPAQVAMGELMMCRPVVIDPEQRRKTITRT